MSSTELRSVLKHPASAADERGMEPLHQLDSSIVERYADHLQRKAAARVMGYAIFFALLGAILGSVPLIAPNRVLIPHVLGLALLLVGAAAGGYLGYTIGVRRAEGLRLQAQVTLHNLQVERLLVDAPEFAERHLTAPAPAPAVSAPLLTPVAPPVVAAPIVAAPVVATPVVAAPVVAAPMPPAPVAPAPVAPAYVPAPPVPAPVVEAPAPAPLAPAQPLVMPAAPPAAPPAFPAARPAMPPLSAPASGAHEVPPPLPAASAPRPSVVAPPLTAAPALPTVPRLVEAPPASPPAMMPPISAER
jgi:hypothetical protein